MQHKAKSLLVGFGSVAAAATVACVLYHRRRKQAANAGSANGSATTIGSTTTQAAQQTLVAQQLFNCSVRLSVKPERRAEFIQAISTARDASLRIEPRALCYIFGEDTTNQNTFHVYQSFASRLEFETQMETPHGAAFHSFLRSGALTGPPNAALWKTVPGSPTAPTAAAASATRGTIRCLNVKMKVRPERRDEFLASILADQKGTLANEPLALAFLVGEAWATEGIFYLHEQYVGEEGFQAHKRAPHFAPWQRFVDSEPFFEPLEVSSYDKM